MTPAQRSTEIARQAKAFWNRVGFIEAFPRSLVRPVLWGLPLAIVQLPRLRLASVGAWLRRQEIVVRHQARDRRLHGCLVARAGHGFIFLDGCDPDDDRRFSLAHEVSHFMRDYLAPRQRAIDAFGQCIIDVLDGIREPSTDERLASALGGVRLGVFTHLLDRDHSGLASRTEVVDAEDGADLLALELLAPRREVESKLTSTGVAWQSCDALSTATSMLRADFGLPATAAERYGRMIVRSRRQPRSFRQWLNG